MLWVQPYAIYTCVRKHQSHARAPIAPRFGCVACTSGRMPLGLLSLEQRLFALKNLFRVDPTRRCYVFSDCTLYAFFLPWCRRRPRTTRCGQSQLAAAALHLLDGVPVHSLALHSLHGDPSRTAEAALVSRFVEARRNVPSVLYLPDAHQWWDGEDSAVHPHLRYSQYHRVGRPWRSTCTTAPNRVDGSTFEILV